MTKRCKQTHFTFTLSPPDLPIQMENTSATGHLEMDLGYVLESPLGSGGVSNRKGSLDLSMDSRLNLSHFVAI